MLKKFLIPTVAGTALATLAAAPALAAQPYAKPDNSWIALSGEVVEVSPETFQLDYGEGLITVEMDGWHWYDDSERLQPGEFVTVAGDVDDDLFEVAKIEAKSVYARERDTYYYASPSDEETAEGVATYYAVPLYAAMGKPSSQPEGTVMTLSGTVTAVQGQEIVLDTGANDVTVDTSALSYNPLDEVGIQQIDTGDVIRVNGQVDEAFFARNELLADTITSIRNDTQMSSS